MLAPITSCTKHCWSTLIAATLLSSQQAWASAKPAQTKLDAQPQSSTQLPKRRLVVKGDLSYLKHKGLLSGFQSYLEKRYDVVYTSDINEHADIFLVSGYSQSFVSWLSLPNDAFRWLFGLDKKKVTPQRICGDSAPIKILYSHETQTSYPEGFDNCFDLMMGYDLKVDHPRYMTIAGAAYEFFHEKISTLYDPGKDLYRAGGCSPSQRKYDVCFLSNQSTDDKDVMSLSHERVELFRSLSEKTYAASGGKVENNIGYIVPRGDELNWMKNCKFVIAYENRTYPGYITEKPYQAWLAGAIPIYAADRSVLGNIDREAVVFGPDYDSVDAVVDQVIGLLKDDNAYCTIWSKSLHIDPDKNYEVLKETVKERLVEIVEEKLD